MIYPSDTAVEKRVWIRWSVLPHPTTLKKKNQRKKSNKREKNTRPFKRSSNLLGRAKLIPFYLSTLNFLCGVVSLEEISAASFRIHHPHYASAIRRLPRLRHFLLSKWWRWLLRKPQSCHPTTYASFCKRNQLKRKSLVTRLPIFASNIFLSKNCSMVRKWIRILYFLWSNRTSLCRFRLGSIYSGLDTEAIERQRVDRQYFWWLHFRRKLKQTRIKRMVDWPRITRLIVTRWRQSSSLFFFLLMDDRRSDPEEFSRPLK